MRTDVNFNWLYVRKLKIEVMYEKPRVNVKVRTDVNFNWLYVRKLKIEVMYERGSNLRLENYNDFN